MLCPLLPVVTSHYALCLPVNQNRLQKFPFTFISLDLLTGLPGNCSPWLFEDVDKPSIKQMKNKTCCVLMLLSFTRQCDWSTALVDVSRFNLPSTPDTALGRMFEYIFLPGLLELTGFDFRPWLQVTFAYALAHYLRKSDLSYEPVYANSLQGYRGLRGKRQCRETICTFLDTQIHLGNQQLS